MFLIPIFMLAALAMVVLGVLNMAKSTGKARKRSNKLMQMRVMFQFIAVILMGLMFFLLAK
jgi:F0F1-type ATP synthase assembly protein I